MVFPNGRERRQNNPTNKKLKFEGENLEIFAFFISRGSRSSNGFQEISGLMGIPFFILIEVKN